MKSLYVCCAIFLACSTTVNAQSEFTLDKRLQEVDAKLLAREAQRRGDPERGALVFYTSAAGCAKCHLDGDQASPLGPNLADAAPEITAEHLVESLLYPSKAIRKGYETTSVATIDGKIVSGLVADDRADALVLRDASDLEQDLIILKDDIEEMRTSDTSMMPDGLVASFGHERDFLDLVRYLIEISDGGPARAAELKPPAEQLVVKDDSANLDHAGILKRMKGADLKAGERIYLGLCKNCHGVDGNTPSLATARAFGRQTLKYGSDPHRMFMTLTRGNGLMAPMLQLSPKERYQVVHYIRETFMKGRNPDYAEVTDEYLAGLPKGTENGDFQPPGDRDYGPALASQLDRQLTSVLSVKLQQGTICYDLHTMNQVQVWKDGFLDLNQTQHVRGRGEGFPRPKGATLDRLRGWQWGHAGSLDYPRDGLLPRGPLPEKWYEYHGHYVHGEHLVLSYDIDGRSILELPTSVREQDAVRHALRIGSGDELILSTAQPQLVNATYSGALSFDDSQLRDESIEADRGVAVVGEIVGEQVRDFAAVAVTGDTQGMTWVVDEQQRMVLRIPRDDRERLIEITCWSGAGSGQLNHILAQCSTRSGDDISDPENLIAGGELKWPQVLTTVGYLGLERGAYAVDTISIPETTPWNTWFRTTALDFFPDGRMAVATYGGDVWVVSGIDDELFELTWKRYAGGLYEPFGIRVVGGDVYVTCKDRLTRLRDLNHDGEADFYESFSADTDVSGFFHAFNFDLQIDSKGNFYYAKSGQYTDYALPGSIVKVSPDGRRREVYCTGFRTPNGMGILSDDRLTASDNQGSWMPASKVSLLKQDGFYGYVQTHQNNRWAPDGGKIDAKKVVPPTEFDQPVIWMPQEFDNSSGGQLFVDDQRWGPLSGRLLHTSFGKGWLYYMMLQDVGDISQAAIVRLPHHFVTGIMRGSVNPADGQVYVTGLDGWNGGARRDPPLFDKGIQRVRYTGRKFRMLSDCQVESDGLRLTFNFELSPAIATRPESYFIEQWDYLWQASYGSNMYHPETGEVGKQTVPVSSVTLNEDGKSVKLSIPEIHPVNQLHLRIQVADQAGNPFDEAVYWTINRVP